MFDKFYDVAVGVLVLRSDLVVKVLTVERGFEDGNIVHAEVFLDVVLHLRGCRGCEGYNGTRSDLVDYRSYAPVFRTEIVAPLRDAMGFVDGKERDLDRAQEVDVVFLGQRLGRNIEELGLARYYVIFYGIDGSLGQRRVEEMGYVVVGTEIAHRIDLIFHQGDQGRNHYGCAFGQKSGQLVAQ